VPKVFLAKHADASQHVLAKTPHHKPSLSKNCGSAASGAEPAGSDPFSQTAKKRENSASFSPSFSPGKRLAGSLRVAELTRKTFAKFAVCFRHVLAKTSEMERGS